MFTMLTAMSDFVILKKTLAVGNVFLSKGRDNFEILCYANIYFDVDMFYIIVELLFNLHRVDLCPIERNVILFQTIFMVL